MKLDPWHLYEFREPDFKEPVDGWHPLENVRVGTRVGKLVSYGPVCEVVFNGYYSPPVTEKVPISELGRVDDMYNLKLRGEKALPGPTVLPKLQHTSATLSKATRITKFSVEGWDTCGEWEVVNGVSGAPVRKFTVKRDGHVRAFTLEPGAYDFRRIS